MEQPLITQASRFLLASLLGVACGVYYDFLRGLRRCLPALTHLLDLCFCLSWLAGNLLFALVFGGGRFRVDMLAATLLGSAAYFLTISRLLLPVFVKFWQLLTLPVRALCRLGKIILIFLKKIVKNIFSSAKKSVTIKRQKIKRASALEGINDAPAQIVTHYKASDPDADDLRRSHDHDATAANQRAERKKRNALSTGR